MYSVIIVEDELLVSIGLQNLVRWADMDMTVVGCAQNGRQGLELYHEKKPDLILTDLKMPVLDGIEMIREIRKNDSDTKIIVLTSYEEYEKIRQAFKLGISDYILKLKMLPEDMETVIGKVRQELDEKKMPDEEMKAMVSPQMLMIQKCRNYILGEEESLSDEVTAYWKNSSVFQLLEMETVSLENQKLSKTKVHQQMVIGLIQEILDEKNSGFIMEADAKCYLIIIFYKEGSFEAQRNADLEYFINRIQTLLKLYTNMQGVFGVSQVESSPNKMRNMYENAICSLKKAFFLSLEYVVWEKDKFDIFFSTLMNFEKNFEESRIFSDSCCKKIKKEITVLKEDKKIPQIDEMQEILVRWMHRISFDDTRYKEKMLRLTIEFAEKLRESYRLQNMIGIFEEYIQEVSRMLDAAKVSAEIEEAILYIRKHYMENSCSVASVAHLVGMNKDYFSSLFKKETGMGFVDYVNDVRIQKAKELLANTNMKVYEVGMEVGFQDESYFSRVFKKTVGVRPKVYKMRIYEWKNI